MSSLDLNATFQVSSTVLVSSPFNLLAFAPHWVAWSTTQAVASGPGAADLAAPRPTAVAEGTVLGATLVASW